MTPITLATALIERVPLPDSVIRAGITYLCGRTSRRLAQGQGDRQGDRQGGGHTEADFARLMAAAPIAVRPDAANAQHYEVPADFFGLVLGARRKYSCCLYPHDGATLDQAEETALAETAEHAELADGQSILELGCGWGSLSLWMAAKYPAARITAVSNSHGQRGYIEQKAAALGLQNLRVVTADMNDFTTEERFDRIVSVEMFEHMTNWQSLLRRVHDWLKPDGRLFIHVFTHRTAPYLFDTADKEDWIAQHFFTGGIMPSEGLLGVVAAGLFAVEAQWRWSGSQYAQTARDWLARMDSQPQRVAAVLQPVYGADTALWIRRWRLFFLATEGLFGYAGGAEWGVSHYRLRPV